MNNRERGFIAGILLLILCMVGLDLLTDSREGVRPWHLAAEGLILLASAVGIFLVLRDAVVLKHALESERRNLEILREEEKRWRQQAKKYLEGLSGAIDEQLTSWRLTNSEKEVAFLLLKGMSLKEIAEARKTTEKTARAQSIAIYAKAGLAGRSELAAFFLEDLLLPQKTAEGTLK